MSAVQILRDRHSQVQRTNDIDRIRMEKREKEFLEAADEHAKSKAELDELANAITLLESRGFKL